MKKVIYTDDDGFKRAALIRDTDPDTMATHGVPCNPPDIRDLDWEQIQIEINNLLVDRGLTDLQTLNVHGLDNAIVIPIKKRLLDAFRQKEKKTHG